ncbi:hypothetical protein TanjilG_18405 [Lupinus angustifolius]|uniref:F-box domain-containing protein n=1 Tax=Lupinus angustifolius TaxID=3871 RepID=A0A4P1RWF2_LUPAN|nr:PREDICTED: F-box protein At2g35280-like [Lupinus angustifolius]OIW19595.1 hypothetical protein TanjilG_18405 [Lupinus angustifolius]
MAGLGVKNKGKSDKKKMKHESISTIKSLPRELLVEIMAKVASASVLDLCKVKLSCKDFLHASEDDYVYQHVSMDKFALVPLPWFINEKESSFLKRCKDSGNSEITYREGMVEYFSSLKIDSGLDNLKKATLQGHVDSKYVYSMILMCSKEEKENKVGFDLFCSLRTSTCVMRCRKRVKSFIRSMWVNNHVVRSNQECLCHSSTCESKERLKKLSRMSLLIQDEDDSTIASCQYCHADYELCFFYKLFEI